MHIFLWVYVVVSAFIPGGFEVMTRHAGYVEAQMRAAMDDVQPRPGLAIGAASDFVRPLGLGR